MPSGGRLQVRYNPLLQAQVRMVMAHSCYWGKNQYAYEEHGLVMRALLQVRSLKTLDGPDESINNIDMMPVRDALEWSYKHLKQDFTSHALICTFKANKYTSLIYKAASANCNVKICLTHGRQVTSYFKSRPHTVDEYLAPWNTVD